MGASGDMVPPPPRQPSRHLTSLCCLIGSIMIVMSMAHASQSLRVVEGVGILLFSLGLWGLVSRSATRPLEEIRTTIRQLEQHVQTLESQRNQAQAILESMVEGVLALDQAGRLLWLNRSAQQLFGVRPEQVTGKSVLEVVRQPELEELVTRALVERRPAIREVQSFAPHEQVVQFQAVPCDGERTEAALVLVAQDVTQIRRLEGMRREFVANVSHELKTPLTSIKGFVETLLDGALEDPANNRRFVSLIDQDTTRLARLIDDLLELSQIESKATPLALQPVSLHQLVEQLAPRFHLALTERRVTLDLRIPKEAPLVAGDPERLRQIFINLLDNAIKFNKTGGRVTVSAEPGDAFLCVVVEDTGIGIPEEHLPRIFERFYRVDQARSRELGGTGLGLAIVKHLVELHHGRIDVRSRVGHGAVFTMTLPLWPGVLASV